MNDEMYYDPEGYAKLNQDEVVDEETGMTIRELNEALRRVAEAKGHSGPFTQEEVYRSVIDVVVGDALKSLEKKGLIDSYMDRTGEMVYKPTEQGKKAAEAEALKENED